MHIICVYVYTDKSYTVNNVIYVHTLLCNICTCKVMSKCTCKVAKSQASFSVLSHSIGCMAAKIIYIYILI